MLPFFKQQIPIAMPDNTPYVLDIYQYCTQCGLHNSASVLLIIDNKVVKLCWLNLKQIKLWVA